MIQIFLLVKEWFQHNQENSQRQQIKCDLAIQKIQILLTHILKKVQHQQNKACQIRQSLNMIMLLKQIQRCRHMYKQRKCSMIIRIIYGGNKYHSLGITLRQLGELNDAINMFDRGIKINPNNAAAYYNKGNTLFHLEQYDAAQLIKNKAIQLELQNYSKYISIYQCFMIIICDISHKYLLIEQIQIQVIQKNFKNHQIQFIIFLQKQSQIVINILEISSTINGIYLQCLIIYFNSLL